MTNHQGTSSTFHDYATSTSRATINGGQNRALQALSEFKRLNPLTFDGVKDPLVAEDWLEQIQKILDTFEAPVELWVKLATF